MKKRTYPPISDYGYIGDCHSSALISRSCSMDWCCMPRVDSPSCFGRLLDWEQGGYCAISPKEHCEVSRRYVEGTLVLETTCFFSQRNSILTRKRCWEIFLRV